MQETKVSTLLSETENEPFMSFFKEQDKITPLLSPEHFQHSNDAQIQICEIFERYQEQAELLDPHLETIITTLMTYVPRRGQHVFDATLANRTFKVLYTLIKIRGYKTIMKFLSHEAADLEPILSILASLDKKDPDSWYSSYGLLLWLAVIVLVPFPLDTIDSSKTSIDITTQIIDLGKGYLGESSVARDAGAVMLSRLFSRPDMDSKYIDNFFAWSIETIKNNPSNHILATGILTALFQISRHGPRSVLQHHIPIVYEQVIKTPLKIAERSGLLRKLTIKLAQRVALSSLRPIVPKWRYQLGARSLLQTLAPTAAVGAGESKEDEQAQEYGDIPEIVDEVIELLLTKGLRDQDTVVRWSAAKGLGRISMRLPEDYADEVVESLLPLLSVGENDGAWHGGCMAFGELARRGLLLPKRLSQVIPLGLQALNYDVRTGSHSVGAHVRDAACYLSWAFARAYAPSVLQPYVLEMSRGLLTLAVFDREVNCRRAAAAAFQENVGRQGNFPHGIEINLAADYLSLGNRVHAFKDVAFFIAGFEEYREHLILHLGTIKYKHWDLAIRELCASALAKLINLPGAAEFTAQKVLPELIVACTADDLCKRHGAVLATAEVVLALVQLGKRDLLRESTGTILSLPARIKAAGHFQGKIGGQIMRIAVCFLMRNLALSIVECNEDIIAGMHQILTENLQHPALEVQMAAVDALRPFLQSYFTATSQASFTQPALASLSDTAQPTDSSALKGTNDSRAITTTTNSATPAFTPPTNFATEQLIQNLVTYSTGVLAAKSTVETRQGFALALGVLPLCALTQDEHLTMVINSLVAASDSSLEPDAQTRTNAVRSLQSVCLTLKQHVVRVIPGAYLPPEFRIPKVDKPPFNRDDPSEYIWLIRSSVSDLNNDATSLEQKVSLEEHNFTVFEKCFRALLRCLRDYHTDNRGDVGSWVREMAMGAIEAILVMMAEVLGSRVHHNPVSIEMDSPTITVTELSSVSPLAVHSPSCLVPSIPPSSPSCTFSDASSPFSQFSPRDSSTAPLSSPVADLATPLSISDSSAANGAANVISQNSSSCSKASSPADIDKSLVIHLTSATTTTTTSAILSSIADPVSSPDALTSTLAFTAATMALGTASFIPCLDDALVTLLLKGLSKQMMEKINRTRGKAGQTFYTILYTIANIPHRAELQACMPAGLDIDWSSPMSLFKRLLPTFLTCSAFHGPVLAGLVQAVGGLTESVVRESGEALLSYFETGDTGEKSEIFFAEMLKLLRVYAGHVRVVNPVLQTINFVFTSGIITELSRSVASDLQTILWKEISGSTNIQKILHAVPVMVGLLSFGSFPVVNDTAFAEHTVSGEDPNKGPFPFILELLVHQYPKVRRAAADELFGRLLLLDLPQSDIIQSLLAETAWDGPNKANFIARDKLATVLGVIPLSMYKAEAGDTQIETKKESYADLVQSAGY